MCERANLDLETSEAERKIDAIDNQIKDTGEKLTEMAKKVKQQTQDSFNEVMNMMRVSYTMVSGLTQALGGSMEPIFGSVFSVAIQSIMTYKAVAAAMALVPGAQLQAGLMFMSLTTAIISLVGAATGQRELSRRVAGLNMTIQSFGSFLAGVNF